jgi:hypothetical protein
MVGPAREREPGTVSVALASRSHRTIFSENDRRTIGTAAAHLVTVAIAVPTGSERFPDGGNSS